MAVWDRLTGAVMGVGIGGAARDALAPTMEVARQSAWGQRAIRVLSAGEAAAASVRGIDHGIDYPDDAKREGVGRNRFRVLEDLARTRPGLPVLLDLWRRDPGAGGDVQTALRREGYTEMWVDRLMQLRNVLPPVSDLVRFGVREVYNPPLRDELGLDAEFPEGFANAAERVGLSRQTARDYWAAHWELPSLEQLIEMLYRTDLTPAGFRNALKAIDIAPVWRRRFEEISRRIPPLQDMIRFAVREAYDDRAAADLGLDDDYPSLFTSQAGLHGMAEVDARRYWRAHWRLPSPTMGYEMLHRRIITRDQLGRLLKALDYPSVWRGRLMDISYRVPGRIDLRRMLGEGVLTRAQVLDGYKDLGYTDTWAERLTTFAERTATGATRDLTAAQLGAQYEGYQLTRAALLRELRQLRYSDVEAEALADLGDARRVKKYRDAVIGKAHSQYIGGFITEAQSAAALGELHLARKSVDELLRLWRVERDIAVTKLTAREIRAAYRRGTVALEDAVAQLRARGYSDADARTFLGLDAPRLSASQIVAAVDSHGITEAEGLRQLVALGYSPADALALLSQNIEELSSRQIVDAVDAHTITREEGIQRLLALGYRPEDAAVLLPPAT